MGNYTGQKARGFTAVEMLVYIALFSAISAFLISSLMTLTVAYRHLRDERDVVSGMRTIMEILGMEIQGADGIYTPTTVFSPTVKQLSLESAVNPNAGETSTYADFYLDNERLYMKREGAAAIALNSESTEVSEFHAERVVAGSRESVQIFLRIRSQSSGNLQTESAVTASFTPLNNY